ncbi:MAG: hypothetical protein LRS48_01745 [Desulfurococcales archaeon]|nr:hypothetical protein [Desulfurococcales archaeon]
MKSVSIPLFIAGLIMVVLVAIPLVEFAETADNINIYSYSRGGMLYLEIDYNDTAPLYNYTISLYSGGVLVDRASGQVLENGDVVILKAPLNSFNTENFTLAISGKIYNLYNISIKIKR